LFSGIAKPFWGRNVINIIEWRTIGLDRHNRLYQIGPRIAYRPAKGAGLRMRQNKRQDGIAIQLLSQS
jgi:hypothetical protein